MWNKPDAQTLEALQLLIARFNALDVEVLRLAAGIDKLYGAEPEGPIPLPREWMHPTTYAVLQGVHDTIAHIAETESASNRERLLAAIAPLSGVLAIDTVRPKEHADL